MSPDSYSHPDIAVQRIKRDGRFSDEEAREIYQRASEIQSQSLFRDESGLTDVELEKGANRAGISDAALEAAIKEREAEKAAKIEAEKQRIAQKAAWTKRGLIGAAVVAVPIVLVLMSAQNSLGARAAAVDSAQAQVENVLERRHNLIPNLISVTKSTLDNQRVLVETLNAANQQARSAGSGTERAAAETKLDSAIAQTLNALQEEAGTSSPVVLRLSDEMAGTENRLAVERRKYNAAVAEYNRLAGSFPIGLAGKMLGYKARYDFFKASDAAKETPRF